jgi:3-phosphoglycerate kinase
METITLTADRSALETAQRVAEEQHTTRDAVLSEWLHRSAGAERVRRFDDVMEKLKYVKTGGPYTRDEMNER